MRLTAKRKTVRAKTVKLRTNGKHKIKGATVKVPSGFGPLTRILRPQAQYRWLTPQVAAITPQYIEQTLIGAMGGANVQQWELFDLMLKTWPELLACYTELVQGVMRKKLIYEPYCDEDEKPTPDAIERSKVVSTALRRMEPEATRDDCDLYGTIEDLLDGWFRGVAVSEIVWQQIEDNKLGTIQGPKATFFVHPCNYAFGTDGALGLRPLKQTGPGMGMNVWPFSTTSVQPNPSQLEPFPDFKFLIAMHKTSAGSILGGPLLRALAWWWCAANFSSDWLLNLAQVFGLPFRWANYDTNAPQATIDAICTMLQNMGSAGWAAFPVGTTLELMQPNQAGSDHSPQGELLDRADRYARLLILGQTMTGTHGTTGKGGGQAFGAVELDVKHDRIEAAGDFACDVINQQLIPFILQLNYGDTNDMPTVRFLEDKEAGLPEAQRDGELAKLGLEIGVDYLRKKYDIPPPAAGEETIGGAPQIPPAFGGGFGQQDFGQQPNDQQPQDMAAGDAPGHEFHGNQYTDVTHERMQDVHSAYGTEAKRVSGYSRTAKSDFNQHEKEILDKIPNEGIDLGFVSNPILYSNATKNLSTTHKRALMRLLHAGHLRIVRSGNNERLIHAIPGVPVAAGDAPGHAFRGNQYIKLGDDVQTPIGRGKVVASDHLHVFVSIHGDRIRQFMRTDVFKIPRDNSNFPSITHSAEDERRRALNMKIALLDDIQDDAVFARELKKLAGVTHAERITTKAG